VPGLVAQVERLVDRPVEVEQEVHGEAAHVLEHAEAARARPGDVVVDHELVDDLAQTEEVRAVRLDEHGSALAALLAAGPVALAARRVVPGPIGSEARVLARRVVARSRIPEHDRRADPETPPARDDLGAGRAGRDLRARRGTRGRGRAARRESDRRERQRERERRFRDHAANLLTRWRGRT
jgi:hypothetical protein